MYSLGSADSYFSECGHCDYERWHLRSGDRGLVHWGSIVDRLSAYRTRIDQERRRRFVQQ